MQKSPKEQRALAEARFERMQRRKADAPLAMQDYLNAQQAEREKTERLRALRLARDAAKV